MATTIRAGDMTLHDLPESSEQEKQQLDRIQASHLHLVSQTSMIEDVVKMAILSPLLYLADFFLPPLSIQSEVAVQLSIADEELAIEGKIDILVVHNQLWLLLIESKRAAASIEVGLPQLLAYMLANPNPVQPVYGMITNGGSFVFLKLVQGPDAAHYALSRIFEMRTPFWQCSNISGTWCCWNNLMSGNGYRATSHYKRIG